METIKYSGNDILQYPSPPDSVLNRNQSKFRERMDKNLTFRSTGHVKKFRYRKVICNYAHEDG
jgi:hypothetical protein